MANKRVLDPCCGRDVREKLVEQKIKGDGESICYKCFHNKVCKAMDNQPCVECNQFVDAHGVTVQEWISVKDRLPQQDEPVGLICEQVQVILSDGFVTTGWCNRSHKAWYYLPYGDTHFIGDSYENTPVIAWQPLAQPPKGE